LIILILIQKFTDVSRYILYLSFADKPTSFQVHIFHCRCPFLQMRIFRLNITFYSKKRQKCTKNTKNHNQNVQLFLIFFRSHLFRIAEIVDHGLDSIEPGNFIVIRCPVDHKDLDGDFDRFQSGVSEHI